MLEIRISLKQDIRLGLTCNINMTEKIAISQFKGIKNDANPKQSGAEYFYDIVNFNFEKSSVLGLTKTLCPKQEIQIDSEQIDGIYEYRFLDKENVLQTEIIVVCNGNIYKTDISSNKTLIATGLSKGKCSFATYQDKLFIANGKDYPYIYYGNEGVISQMGSPLALPNGSVNSGNLNGTYKYQLTYVTSGGEEVTGSISNSVELNHQSTLLKLPIGYDGTTARKLYRTTANGNTFYLITTLDNATLEYTDNLSDVFLSDEIPEINNELPKPYFLSVAGSKLFGGKVDKYPTQLFVTDVFGEIFDSASYIDISNYSNDNTPIEAVAEDFNKILVGTGKNIFLVAPSDNSVVLTRANIGILDGYSVAKCPSFNNFAGGLMFVSTEYDVRLMSGIQALPVSTSLDNVTTVNFAQNIQGTFPNDLKGYGNIASIFYDYKYMLQVDNVRYVFDIRNSAWTKQRIKTENFESIPTTLAVIDNQLINGQIDGYLETEYLLIKYKDEECKAVLESVEINAQSDFTFVEKLFFWFTYTEQNSIRLDVTLDSNTSYTQNAEFSLIDGAFNDDFIETDYTRCKHDMDYRVFNIYKPCRWLKYKLSVDSGVITLENFEIAGQQISNKE